jgi:hypothetical protein
MSDKGLDYRIYIKELFKKTYKDASVGKRKVQVKPQRDTTSYTKIAKIKN